MGGADDKAAHQHWRCKKHVTLLHADMQGTLHLHLHRLLCSAACPDPGGVQSAPPTVVPHAALQLAAALHELKVNLD